MLKKFFNKFKIVILALVLSCTLLAATATPTYAQEGIFDRFNKAVADKVGTSLQKFTMNTLSYMVQGSLLMLVGCKGDTCNPDYKIGAMGATGTMLAALYTPQASGVEYVASTLQDFGLVEKAYAQTGTGFDGLQPIRNLWKDFRNITYGLFVVIFLVIGLAIMFKYKLNPQTVVTIQSALPRIVVALLLVTFSYAIAGFLIDLLYVAISLSALAFRLPTADYNELGFFATFGSLFNLVGLGTTTLIGGIMGGFIGILTGNPLNALAGAGIGAALLTLLLIIIVLYVLIRLFLALLQSYIAIILLVIFSPIYIAAGAIPGFGGFGSWLRNLSANLAVFAGVAFVLMLGAVLVGITQTGGLWAPPILFGGTLGGWEADQIRFLIALGILFTVAQVPNAVRNAFGVRGLGIQPEYGPATAVPGLAARGAVGYNLERIGTGTGTAGAVARAAHGALRSARII